MSGTFEKKEVYQEPEKRRFEIWFFRPDDYSRLFNWDEQKCGTLIIY